MMSRGAFIWWATCASLGAAAFVVWQLPVDAQLALRWNASSWPEQPWTLWSAALTHINAAHLSVNLLALLCLCIIGSHLGAGMREAIALLLAWPLLHLALLLWPQVQGYTGFSGLNHAIAGIVSALFAINLVAHRSFQAIGFLLSLMIVAKLLWEAAWAQPLSMDASWGFAVVQAAHLTGFVCGLLLAISLHTASHAQRIFRTKAVVE
jgi:rhomboid family GlyGly-CTERM serine protease